MSYYEEKEARASGERAARFGRYRDRDEAERNYGLHRDDQSRAFLEGWRREERRRNEMREEKREQERQEEAAARRRAMERMREEESYDAQQYPEPSPVEDPVQVESKGGSE